MAQGAFGFRPWAEAPPAERARWADVARLVADAIDRAPRGRRLSPEAEREQLARIAAEAYAIKKTTPPRAWDEKPPESRQRWFSVADAVSNALRQSRTSWRTLH